MLFKMTGRYVEDDRTHEAVLHVNAITTAEAVEIYGRWFARAWWTQSLATLEWEESGSTPWTSVC